MNKLLFFIAFLILLSCKEHKNDRFLKLEGHALGTTFHLTFEDLNNSILEHQIDSIIHRVNKSMSTYLPNSDISKINQGDTTIIVDKMFQEVFNKSIKIYNETNGAFDPTIGILVNAWGFGPDKMIENLDSSHVVNMLDFVGLDKVKLKKDRIYKKYNNMYIDFNAIAKGYAVDVIGRFLESKNIKNYLVEIGGEIRAQGVNQNNKPWRVAIEKPNFDGSRSFQTTIDLKNESIATSGNYRKYKIDSKTGKKYAHTIDTKTGFPSKSNLLSASVIAEMDCADVDAYATALMAMGFKKSKQFLVKHSNLKGLLIYSDDKGEIKTYESKNFKQE